MRKLFFFIVIPFLLGSKVAAQEDPLKSLIEPGAKLEKLADGFQFTEGPTADAKGNVYFTDQPSNKIHIWSTEGVLSTFLDPAGRANGLAFDSKGNLWCCAEEKYEMWIISPDKKVTILPSLFEGKMLNGPNDVWVRKNGGAYFSDPFFKRTWGLASSKSQDILGVYYITPDHKSIIRVISDLKQPNGLIGSPDGKTLYVADMGGRKTYTYKINKDGSLTDKKLFCEMGSDGVTLDEKGNFYTTGNGGVTIFDKTGKKIGNIPVPESWTANVCFGGKDMKSLFITASKGLYRIKMTVKGANT
jgi:gluconolactonase